MTSLDKLLYEASQGVFSEISTGKVNLDEQIDGVTLVKDVDGKIKVSDNFVGNGGGIDLPINISDVTNLQDKLDDTEKYTDDKITLLLNNLEQDFTKNGHKHEISDIDSLQSELDGKVNQTDLTDLQQIVDTKADITHSHETSEINGLQTLIDDSIQTKLDEFDIGETAPLAHTHTTTDITDLEEFVNRKVTEASLGGDVTLDDASLTVKGITQLSNAIDSTEEDKSATPLAISTALTEAKNYTDTEIAELATTSDTKYAESIHTHEINDVTDLQVELDKKALKTDFDDLKVNFDSHVHDISEVNNLQDALDSKVSSTEFDTHTHEIIDVNGLETALTSKADKLEVDEDIDNLTVEVDSLKTNTATNNTDITAIKSQLANGVAPAIHKHEISDVNLLQETLDSKALKTDLQTLSNNFNIHKHLISDVSDLQLELDGKALKTEFNLLKNNFDGHKHEITDVNLLQDTLADKAPLNHSHAWNQITGRPTATTAQIDDAISKVHTHDNMTVLSNLEDGNGVLIYNGSPLGEVAYISVQTVQDRDNIPMTARKEGLMVLVLDDGGMYYLKGGIDNAFWRVFSISQDTAISASALPATPSGNLTGTNTQSLIDELEVKKANKADVYSKAEMTTFMENYPIDYYTLENLPNISQLHNHENMETLNLFSQFQGNLTWKGKTLGDLMMEIYDADKNFVIDKAQTLEGLVTSIAELNHVSGATSNLQAQINSLSSGTTYRGEYTTYQEMITTINNPSKGDWVFILTDENKGAENTQYLHDGVEWVYGGGTAKTPDATSTSKGVIQLGGDLAGTGTSATSPKLTETGVTAGLYKSANITVDSRGRITHAEEGNQVFLNDTIVSEDEGWSSKKINEEMSKLSPSNHTHAQLHDANRLGNVILDQSIEPTDKMVISYDSVTGKAKWSPQQGGRVMVGSKYIEGSYTLKAGSYISLSIDEQEKTVTINSTFRDGGGTSLIPSGVEITHTVTVAPNSSERFSLEAGFNKVMLHTVQMSNDKNAVSELRIYNQSPSVDNTGFIEYHSNSEMQISDIVNIPIFDYDNSKMMHLEVVNKGIEEAKFKIRLKVTNLQ